MAKLSEQVQNQIRVSDKVVASAVAHADTIAEALAKQAAAIQGAKTMATVSAYKAVILALADGLFASTTALRDAEQLLAAERADDVPIRIARDGTAAELANLLGLLRSSLESHLGGDAVSTYGLAGDTPRAPSKLLNHALNIVQLLEKNHVQMASPLGSTFDTKMAAGAIRSKADELAACIKDDNTEARELEEALARRDRASAAWSDAYQGTASALEGLYRQAGWKELSDKVRPTQRRLRGEDAGPEEEADAAPKTPAEG